MDDKTLVALKLLFTSREDALTAVYEAFNIPLAERRRLCCPLCMRKKREAHEVFSDAMASWDPDRGKFVLDDLTGDELMCTECGEGSRRSIWVPVTWRDGDPIPDGGFDEF